MQLSVYLKALFFAASLTVVAQDTPQSTPATPAAEPVLAPADVNILGSYYQQDGNHAAVTGGIGTEHLTDITPTIIVNVPLDTGTNLNVNFGMDVYTSASSDNINFNVSSASSRDTRFHLNVGLSKRNSYKQVTRSLTVGFSTEYDVQSGSVAVSWSKESRDGNRELTFSGQAFYDVWTLIYPEELRGRPQPWLNTNTRQSYNFSVMLAQVINRRMQGALMADVVYQSGLLSTPFHRVYFKEQELAQVEQLPGSRLKFPLGARLNYYASDYLTLRLLYRFYIDDWGLLANTAELEAPVKIGPFFSVIPFYRFHVQTEADYFAPYKEHTLTEAFFTSDYDLSAFNSHKVGLGLRYSPLMGVFAFGLPFTSNTSHLKSIDLRYANYWRSDGLKAFIVSTDLGFTIP